MRTRLRRAAAALVAGALAPSVALAHEGCPVAPHDFREASAWIPAPGSLALVVASAMVYALGVRTLRRAAGPDRGIRRWERNAFAAGWIVLTVALVTPLHPLGESLLSAHMTQHELIMVVAAPLLVLGRPLVAAVWALPRAMRPGVGRAARVPWFAAAWRWISAPFAAWLLHALAIWGWHAPRLYEATRTNGWLHAAQHTSFLLTALLFWWALLRPRSGGLGAGAGIVYVFTTALHTSVLGALMAFSTSLWYPAYAVSTPMWGIDPVDDQQLAGLIMWVPGGIAYLVAALALMRRLLDGGRHEAAERRARAATAGRTA